MTVGVSCDHCGQKFTAPEKFLDRKVRCPSCGERFTVRPPDSPRTVARDDVLEWLGPTDKAGNAGTFINCDACGEQTWVALASNDAQTCTHCNEHVTPPQRADDSEKSSTTDTAEESHAVAPQSQMHADSSSDGEITLAPAVHEKGEASPLVSVSASHVPDDVEEAGQANRERAAMSFAARLPSAMLFPFRGNGVVSLLLFGIAFTAPVAFFGTGRTLGLEIALVALLMPLKFYLGTWLMRIGRDSCHGAVTPPAPPLPTDAVEVYEEVLEPGFRYFFIWLIARHPVLLAYSVVAVSFGMVGADEIGPFVQRVFAVLLQPPSSPLEWAMTLPGLILFPLLLMLVMVEGWSGLRPRRVSSAIGFVWRDYLLLLAILSLLSIGVGVLMMAATALASATPVFRPYALFFVFVVEIYSSVILVHLCGELYSSHYRALTDEVSQAA